MSFNFLNKKMKKLFRKKILSDRLGWMLSKSQELCTHQPLWAEDKKAEEQYDSNTDSNR
jgi:hypothetical protein